MNRIIVFVIMLSVSSSLTGQSETDTFHMTIQSEHLDQDQTIRVSLPKNYQSKRLKCHTLCLLDGDVLGMATTIRAIRDELFESGGYIQPLIIVGIEQIHRSRELNPYGKTGQKFFSFIDHELIPRVDSMYHTLPDRIISGHSLGGYFALHTSLKSSKINSCFAFGQSIFNRENQITSNLREHLDSTQVKGTVYVNNGTEGSTEKKIKGYISELINVFHQNSSSALDFQYKEYEGYGHNFTPVVGMTDVLLLHFSKWSPDDDVIQKLWKKELDPLQTFDSFCKESNQKLVFLVEYNNDLLNDLAAHYNRTDEVEVALNLIDRAVVIDSSDLHSHLVKGEILMKWRNRMLRKMH